MSILSSPVVKIPPNNEVEGKKAAPKAEKASRQKKDAFCNILKGIQNDKNKTEKEGVVKKFLKKLKISYTKKGLLDADELLDIKKKLHTQKLENELKKFLENFGITIPDKNFFSTKKHVKHNLGKKVTLANKLNIKEKVESGKDLLVKKPQMKELVIIDLRDKMKQVPKSVKIKPNNKTPDSKLQTKKQNLTINNNTKIKNTEVEVKVFAKTELNNQVQQSNQNRLTTQQKSTPVAKDFLSRVQEILRNEIVKNTGIIIRNSGDGEIRLLLKPESLGSVRIRVQIQDNNIIGKIIVDNNSVKELIESNLGQLQNSIKADGFASAMLDVSVGNGKPRDDHELPHGIPRLGVESIEQFEQNLNYYDEPVLDDSLVNIVV